MASPPGTRMTVSTTGTAPTSRWRTAASVAGWCQRSSAPIHQSNDQERPAGVTRPRGSTAARSAEGRAPRVVQLRWVTLAGVVPAAAGTKSGLSGSDWRANQYGSWADTSDHPVELVALTPAQQAAVGLGRRS